MQSKYTPLGIVGIIVTVIGLLVWLIRAQFSPYSVTPLVLGVLMVLAYALLNINFLTQLLTKRSAVEGANMAVGIIIVLAIIVFLQMILSKYSTRLDLTEAKKFSLAPQTIQLLKGLQEELRFQYLINPSSPGNTTKAKDLMEMYTHFSDKINTETIDPQREPDKVKALAPVTLDAIYVRKGDQHEKVTPVDENNLTNAIMKLVKGGGRAVYFTSGHDEHPVNDENDRDGMGGMKKILLEEGYDVKDLKLATVNKVPDDAVAVVIAGPQRPFFETELQTLSDYLKYGGRLLVMEDPESKTGLDEFLKKYGVEMGNNWVVENNPLMKLFGGGSPVAPMASQIESHPIVDPFEGGMPAITFPIVQSVKLAQKLPEGEEGKEFLKTSPSSWAETNIENLKATGKEKYDQGQDIMGPIPLAVALTLPAEEKVSSATEEKKEQAAADPEKEKEKPESRLVVYGDSDFATNKLYSNSYDLFTNTVNWLAKQEDLISIRPKEDAGQPIMISQVDSNFVFYTSQIILPGFVAIIGIVITLRKKFLG